MSKFLEQHVVNTLRLHRAMHKYGSDSAEADVIRDELDGTWYQLSDSEQDLIGDISELIAERTDEAAVRGRALEIMHSDFASNDSQSIDGYIREAKEDIESKARRELESEGKDGA